jgi:hypothetical protein
VERFTDWKGREVAVRYSRLAKVPYLLDWRDNVTGLKAGAAPPPFLTRQARHYVARRDWFDPEDADALAEKLGCISKIQSVRSEDALTWSSSATTRSFSAVTPCAGCDRAPARSSSMVCR